MEEEEAERRRAALREHSKEELVEFCLRLQEQVRGYRAGYSHALDDGIAEGRRLANAREIDCSEDSED